MDGNLFVVSRLGQLRNVQSFIRQFGAADNYLAILFTEENMALLSAIEVNIAHGLFSAVVHIKQPSRPLAQSRKTNRVIYDQIDELLVSMSAQNGVRNLFLCNVDAYYSFFERVVVARQLGVRLILLEEGLGTYANTGGRAYALDTTPDRSDLKYRARAFVLALRRAAKSFAALAVTLTSWVLRRDVHEVRAALRTALITDPSLRYGVISHFAEAYVYFPDLVREGSIRIERVNRLAFAPDHTAPSAVLQAVPEGCVVFVSQKYIGYRDYLDILLRIFEEMGLEEVYFKFHPRESLARYGKDWDNVLARHHRTRLVATDGVQSVAVEELIIAGKVRQLVGLTSSSLMYATSFFPTVDVVSIGRRFRELAESDEYQIPKAALAEFVRDLEVFLDVTDVRQV